MDVRRLVVTNRDSSPLCRDCGYCCTRVVLDRSAQECLEWETDSRQVKWLKSDLVELSPQEAEATGMMVSGLADEGLHVYKCQMWDPATGGCTDYANRPETCRSFPYYLMKHPGLKSTYKEGCKLSEFLYSLVALHPQDIELRKNGHVAT